MRLCAAFGAAVLAVCSVPLVVAAPAAAATTPQITMTVTDVVPNTPPISTKPTPVVFTLKLTNNTTATLSDVTVEGTRADPITSQDVLDAALKSVPAPTDELRSDIKTENPVVAPSINPGASQIVTFATTTGSDPGAGICQCGSYIYPIYFTASTTIDGQQPTELGHAQTYLPSFTPVRFTPDSPTVLPQKTRVAWLWPLLDRPHRLRQDDLFSDDQLADELGSTGRLTRLLDVLQNVTDRGVAMTVVADPDLIDSLAVMTTGYRVNSSDGIVAGSNGQLAAQWLTRLRAVLSQHPTTVDLVFTAFADPAVNALSRSGLTWSATASPAAQQRITAALGVFAPSDITWPVDQRVSGTTLGKLRQQGTTTVVLTDAAFRRGTAKTATGRSGNLKDTTSYQVLPDALARVRTAAGAVTAAVTSSPIEALVRKIVTGDAATALPLLPKLVAELAVRVVSSFETSHFVVITPPRALNVQDPVVAERAIMATASTGWSQPVLLRGAVATLATVDHGALRRYDGGRSLPAGTTKAVKALRHDTLVASDLFADPDVATERLGTMDVAIQRSESTALLADRGTIIRLWRFLGRYVHRINSGVQLAQLYSTDKSRSATYTLASRNASLPVTVVNTLDATVRVEVRITANSPGLTADDTKARTLTPGQRVQLRIPVHTSRVGRIPITIDLRTAGGLSTGVSKDVMIRSTALGAIGVVITVVAGAILVLAVLVRLVRRTLYRRRQRPAETA